MAKHGFRLLVAVLALFGAMTFSATEIQAQSTDITLMNQSQNFNWISEAEATSLLESQLIVMANNLTTLPPGSPAYKDMVNHITYYKLILGGLGNGLSTMQSTNSNLMNVSNENGSKDASASPINLNLLYQDAVGLLTI